MPTGTTLGAEKAYTAGVVREWRTTPNPGVYSQPTALYEITLDGSNRTRRLFEMRPHEMPPLLNRQAEEAVFGGFLDGKYMVLVYDVSSWRSIAGILRNSRRRTARVHSHFLWLARTRKSAVL